MSRVRSKAAKAVAAAGGGIPGTNEAAGEASAIEAEAVVQPGGSVAEVLAGVALPAAGSEIAGELGERADDAEPGLALNLATLADVVRYDCAAGVLSHLHVRALPEQGFRRAGRFWPPGEGVTVFADDFSAEQIQALLSEPMLAVTLIGREAEG